MRVWIGAFAGVLAMSVPVLASDPVLLHAAGSLRPALTEIAGAFENQTGVAVKAKFGASGLLKEAIAGGEGAQVFASANMEHPQALADAGKSGPVVLFVRNRLCALTRSGLAVDAATLLDRMLDPGIRLATSTPRNDPAGDYAWEVFNKAEAIRPGAFAALERKALQLVGGAAPAPAPTDRSVYGALLADGKADLFLTYCTNAGAAARENPGQSVVPLPDALAVAADYGLTVMAAAPPDAYRLALFILSAPGQAILAMHGFTAPNLPEQRTQP
jgi:molybdate transport system substrate-binding protein